MLDRTDQDDTELVEQPLVTFQDNLQVATSLVLAIAGSSKIRLWRFVCLILLSIILAFRLMACFATDNLAGAGVSVGLGGELPCLQSLFFC